MKITRPAPLTGAAVVSLIFLSLIPVHGQRAGTRAATERALREVDAEWAAAAQAKDFDKVLSYYSATAIELPPNAPARRTRESIKKSWEALIRSPGSTLSWLPVKVEVSESRDLGYIAGSYEYTQTDPVRAKDRRPWQVPRSHAQDRRRHLEMRRRELELRPPRAQKATIVGRASCPPL